MRKRSIQLLVITLTLAFTLLSPISVGQASAAGLLSTLLKWSTPQSQVKASTPVKKTTTATSTTTTSYPRKMQVLVITATGEEPAFAAATNFLQRIGIPYQTLIATKQDLTANFLAADGTTTGNYQGVLLTSGSLSYQTSAGDFQSAFTDAEWQELWKYEAKYGVRQATYYTYPGAYPESYGLTVAGSGGVDTLTKPLEATLTEAGASIFSYLNRNAKITINGAWTYLAKTEAGATPLLQTADGYTLAAVKTFTDGRENLAFTMDQNADQQHSLLLNYGMFNWLTKGLFIGERKTYLSVQPDDLMIADAIWDPATLTDTSGKTYRMTDADLKAVVAWQQQFAAQSLFKGWKIEWPFNGSGAAATDKLTQAIKTYQSQFRWINHTWDHLKLDDTTYAVTATQLSKNNTLAKQYGFTAYSNTALVTPEVSGLKNAAAMKAAYDQGVRYVVSDSSKVGEASSTPNTGIPNAYQPGILQIPRYATNIYYNVSTPEEEVSEYNYLYKSYWGRELTYNEIVELESNTYLRYMLRYDINPLMFHQSNTRAYDGKNSLLSDVMNRTAVKYTALVKLPVVNLSQQDIGKKMQQRMDWNAATVTAIYYPANKKITLQSNKTATVPVTGINLTGSESYGGQYIYPAKLTANKVVTLQVK